ncbi:MAG: ribonuclease P protein component [Rhodopirellula sp. TMED11]|nr:MAG: ribonuclease P protein component [Rhodopirellula sp. TMED11]
MGQTFPKTRRVISSQQFTLALRTGACAADGCLVVFVVPADSERSPNVTRLGITIPKKTGNAVIRNQWKRWIRESFRTQCGNIPTGYDLIVRPKKGARGDWKSIQKSLPVMARKAIKRLSAGS